MQDFSARKGFDALFGEAGCTVGKVVDRAERAVSEAEDESGFVFGDGDTGGITHTAGLYRNDFTARQIAHQVNIVTGFADNAPPTHLQVLRPVIGGDSTGIHGHHKRLRFVDTIQQFLHFLDLRGEAAVEANH